MPKKYPIKVKYGKGNLVIRSKTEGKRFLKLLHKRVGPKSKYYKKGMSLKEAQRKIRR